MTTHATVKREALTIRCDPAVIRWLKSKAILADITLSRAAGEVLEQAHKESK